jgi:aryl-alcohol dehydrogenase-like predicted oxidoreductase
MERRRLGKTDHLSSVVAFGTFAIGNLSQADADRTIDVALAHGINHFDVAPSYGEAELRLGDYLKRHPQPDLFIGCKTRERTATGAREELLRTLDRLGRERHDLYQFHAVGERADLDEILAPGGAAEAVAAARQEGLVAHVGITGHGMTAPATHAEALRRLPLATVMVAVNPYLHSIPTFRRDWQALVTACRAADVGIHTLKAIARAPWGDRPPEYHTWYEPLTDQTAIDRAVAWTLDQPVTTLCSAGDATLFPKIVAAAERYRPGAVPPETAMEFAGHGNIFVAASG